MAKNMFSMEDFERFILYLARKGDEFHLDVIPNIMGDSPYLISVSTIKKVKVEDRNPIGKTISEFMVEYLKSV